MAKISVVVPTYDRPVELDRALTSVRRLETQSIRIELLVIDNGHNPETPLVAARHGAGYHQFDKPGAARSRNVGLALATSEYIAFLDDDDYWSVDHLAPHIGFLESHQEFGAALGRIQGVTAAGEPIGDPYPVSLPEDGRVFDEFLRDWTQIGAFVLRKQVARTVGDFDPGVEGGEDWEWVLRLARVTRVRLIDAVSLSFSHRGFDDPTTMTVGRSRVACNRRIFWRHARRGHGTFKSLADLPAYLRFRGCFFGTFVNIADANAGLGNRSAFRAAMVQALLASPPHFAVHFLKDSDFRRLTLGRTRARP